MLVMHYICLSTLVLYYCRNIPFSYILWTALLSFSWHSLDFWKIQHHVWVHLATPRLKNTYVNCTLHICKLNTYITQSSAILSISMLRFLSNMKWFFFSLNICNSNIHFSKYLFPNNYAWKKWQIDIFPTLEAAWQMTALLSSGALFCRD